uniref:Eif3 n=1 Tax=Arundo donax TaxID=35708 RepID=A0A0A9DJ21_ARUDO
MVTARTLRRRSTPVDRRRGARGTATCGRPGSEAGIWR